ncbi:MAG: hypothetical protein KBD24_02365 [Candidatus Pacebacteria bacterium]|nr:hypothetical protein [Candidatus Paceibacterota bacterium]
MIRFVILFIGITIIVWAPWMDRGGAARLSDTILSAYGPMPAQCFDTEGKVLQEGVEVRWYPMGRLAHTCTGDYVVWLWGDVKELGGVAKKAEEIQAVHSKPLSCEEVLKRQEARRATSTDNQLVRYEGKISTVPDFSIFPEAKEYRNSITSALQGGVNFAGRFAVADWECGQNCQNHAIMDVETGQVVAHGLQTEYGVEFTADSTLFVTNPLTRLPKLPDNPYETESMALSLARLQRGYYRLTFDVLSGTRYLVLQCVESASTGYIEVQDERIGVITNS